MRCPQTHLIIVVGLFVALLRLLVELPLRHLRLEFDKESQRALQQLPLRREDLLRQLRGGQRHNFLGLWVRPTPRASW